MIEPVDPTTSLSGVDPQGRRFTIRVLPLEHDPTIDEDQQPQAIMFLGEDGWIYITPVGADFRPEDLTQEELAWLLAYAEGETRPRG